MTRDLAHEALVALTGGVAVRLGVASLDPRQHALEVGVVRAHPAVAVLVADVHLARRPAEDRLAPAGRQFLPRRVQVEALGVGDTLQQAQEVLARLAAAPRRDRALVERLLRVGDDKLRVDLLARAQTDADRAGAERRVERERARLEFVDGQRVVVRAGEAFGVAPLAVRVVVRQIDEVEDHQPAGQAERGLDRIGDALLAARPHDEPVDDRLDRVLLLLLELDRRDRLR